MPGLRTSRTPQQTPAIFPTAARGALEPRTIPQMYDQVPAQSSGLRRVLAAVLFCNSPLNNYCIASCYSAAGCRQLTTLPSPFVGSKRPRTRRSVPGGIRKKEFSNVCSGISPECQEFVSEERKPASQRQRQSSNKLLLLTFLTSKILESWSLFSDPQADRHPPETSDRLSSAPRGAGARARAGSAPPRAMAAALALSPGFGSLTEAGL